MALFPWRRQKSISLDGHDLPYGNKVPPSNFNDHTTILNYGHTHDDNHEVAAADEHKDSNVDFDGAPEHQPLPHYLDPPMHQGVDNGSPNVQPHLHSPPTVSLGGEGIVLNSSSGVEPGHENNAAVSAAGGVTNPLEPKPDALKPWGGHELTDDAMGLNPHPGKPQS
jgi:hypothetical protein